MSSEKTKLVPKLRFPEFLGAWKGVKLLSLSREPLTRQCAFPE